MDKTLNSVGTDIFKGKLQKEEPMSRHTSWRVGGVASRAYWPANLSDLVNFVRQVPDSESLIFVGLGSNLLVRDGGFQGTIVFTHPALTELRLDSQTNDNTTIFVEAGVASPKTAVFSSKKGLTGLEFLVGIPGTIGGALKMNAGCYGKETWDIVENVLTLSRDGFVRRRDPEDFDIGYRHIKAKFDGEEFFVGCWFRSEKGDVKNSVNYIKEIKKKRLENQPLSEATAGSVFQNPPDRYAGELIENCGLKGCEIGGAQVSNKHANFFVNKGDASAKDFETLIRHVSSTVLLKTGVQLHEEIRIIGKDIL